MFGLHWSRCNLWAENFAKWNKSLCVPWLEIWCEAGVQEQFALCAASCAVVQSPVGQIHLTVTLSSIDNDNRQPKQHWFIWAEAHLTLLHLWDQAGWRSDQRLNLLEIGLRRSRFSETTGFDGFSSLDGHHQRAAWCIKEELRAPRLKTARNPLLQFPPSTLQAVSGAPASPVQSARLTSAYLGGSSVIIVAALLPGMPWGWWWWW